MKKRFSSKALKQMETDAKRGKWHNLIRLDEIPDFLRWLKNHEWQAQSPDYGEAMRAYKCGWTITVSYDGHRTTCGRLCMALWHTYQCFKEE